MVWLSEQLEQGEQPLMLPNMSPQTQKGGKEHPLLGSEVAQVQIPVLSHCSVTWVSLLASLSQVHFPTYSRGWLTAVSTSPTAPARPDPKNSKPDMSAFLLSWIWEYLQGLCQLSICSLKNLKSERPPSPMHVSGPGLGTSEQGEGAGDGAPSGSFDSSLKIALSGWGGLGKHLADPLYR